MKLSAFIKPFKCNSFTIPIYTNRNGEYFYHKLDDKFCIKEFEKASIDKGNLNILTDITDYQIGKIGSLIFNCEGNITISGNANECVIRIWEYLKFSKTLVDHIKLEVLEVAKILNIELDQSEKNNQVQSYKEQDLKYYEEQIYDFLSPKELIADEQADVIPLINNISELIDNYLQSKSINRKRKSSFKSFKKDARHKKTASKKGKKHTIKKFNPDRIDNFKNYFIKYIADGRRHKAFQNLFNLIEYQMDVSNQNDIVKSICDLAYQVTKFSNFQTAKLLLSFAYIFEVKDIIISSQYAEVLKAEGNLQGAKQLYIDIQKQFPDNVVARNGYAEVLKAEGNLQGAKQLYIDIQKQFPDNVVAKSGYAEVLKAEGNLQDAKQLYIDIQKQFPDNVVAKSGYAEVLKAEGNLQDAKQLYIDIQKQFPDDIVAKTGYAEILKAEGNLQDAKQLYIDIQKQFPDNIVAKSGYAEVLKAEGNLHEAKQLYIDIQKQFPDNIVAKSGYAEVLKAEGNLQDAKRLYIDIQKQFPNDVVAKTGYAEILKAEGSLQDAKQTYIDIQKQFPDNIVAKTGYAEILKAEGNLQDAKQLYIDIQKQFPDNVVAKNGYAEVLKAEGNLHEAKQMYLDIQKQFPDNVVAKAGYAEVLKAEGNLHEAKQLYIDIQKQFPNDVVVKNGYAEILKAEGNLQDAKQLYIDIQKQFPDDPYVCHGLANLYLLLEDYPNYLKLAKKIESPKTQSDFYFYHSNIIYKIKMGDLAEAEKLLSYGINTATFSETIDVFKRTIIYLRILKSDFVNLMSELNSSLEIVSYNPIDDVFRTHVFAENSKIEAAKNHFNRIKNFPNSTSIYSNAELLSEIYDLNGLPKKDLSKDELNVRLLLKELESLMAA